MGYSSQSGQVAFREQEAKGVKADDIEENGIAMRITSGGLAGERELLVPDAEIGGGRDVQGGLLGTISFAGDFEYYVRMNALATQLKAVLGVAQSEPVGGGGGGDEEGGGGGGPEGVYMHTITPSDGAIPFYTIYERISNGLLVSNYIDCAANSFSLEVEPNGQMTATTSWIGARNEFDVPELDVDGIYDNGPMVAGTNVTVSYAGVEIPAKSFSTEIANNIEDDDYRLGSFFLEDMTPKQREVTNSMTIRHEDAVLLRQALFGSATASAVSCSTDDQPIIVTANTCEVIGDTALTYELELEYPNCIVEPFAFEPSGDDVIENDVTFRAVRPDLGTPILTARIRNSIETIA